MGNILSVQKVQKYYGNKASLTRALDVISFDVEQGEFLAIMGASGSGKTTLLNCISTIDKVTAGHIFVAGKDITGLKGKELNRSAGRTGLHFPGLQSAGYPDSLREYCAGPVHSKDAGARDG